MELGDLDGDGDADLVTRRAQSLYVMTGSVGASFASPLEHDLDDVPTYLALGDLEGDGRDDFAVTSKSADQVTVGRVLANCPVPLGHLSFAPVQVTAISTSFQTVQVSGSSFCGLEEVRVDGLALPPSSVQVPELGKLTFHMPLVSKLGPVTVEVTANGELRQFDLLVAPVPSPTLTVPVQPTPADGARLVYAADPGDWVFAFASLSSQPSVLPGVVSFDMGAGFHQLYGLFGDVIGAKGWSERTIAVGSPSSPTQLFFQAAIWDPGAGGVVTFETTNVAATYVAF